MRPYGHLRFLVLAISLAVAAPASGMSLGFGCLTGNDPGDCAIGEAQLSVDVIDLGGGQVAFEFANSGPAASVISEIYFDDGSLLGLSSVVNGPGVDFVPDASPPNLPGGDTALPPFIVTAGFLAEASPAPSMNGVGAGEWVRVIFGLGGGGTHADVLAELDSGTLRIGIHVIAFASGGSESFINVPEPGTVLLALAALAYVGLRRRAFASRA